MVDYAHLWDADNCIFGLPLISLNGMVEPSKMPPALAKTWFNKSLLSWDHLLKPNELIDVECEMYSCMSCCQVQPFESFAVHEERILMWLLMSTEDIWHLKMCPHDKTEHKNKVKYSLFWGFCVSETRWWSMHVQHLIILSLTATCAVYQPWNNCYKSSNVLTLKTGTLLPQQLSPWLMEVVTSCLCSCWD